MNKRFTQNEKDALFLYEQRGQEIEDFLRYEIYELASERVRIAIGAFLNLQQDKFQCLGFKVEGTNQRIVIINYETRTVSLE